LAVAPARRVPPGPPHHHTTPPRYSPTAPGASPEDRHPRALLETAGGCRLLATSTEADRAVRLPPGSLISSRWGGRLCPTGHLTPSDGPATHADNLAQHHHAPRTPSARRRIRAGAHSTACTTTAGVRGASMDGRRPAAASMHQPDSGGRYLHAPPFRQRTHAVTSRAPTRPSNRHEHRSSPQHSRSTTTHAKDLKHDHVQRYLARCHQGAPPTPARDPPGRFDIAGVQAQVPRQKRPRGSNLPPRMCQVKPPRQLAALKTESRGDRRVRQRSRTQSQTAPRTHYPRAGVPEHADLGPQLPNPGKGLERKAVVRADSAQRQGPHPRHHRATQDRLPTTAQGHTETSRRADGGSRNATRDNRPGRYPRATSMRGPHDTRKDHRPGSTSVGIGGQRIHRPA